MVHETSFRKGAEGAPENCYGTEWRDSVDGTDAQEFKRMVSLGMSPMDAIQSATSRAAEMLDMKGEIG